MKPSKKELEKNNRSRSAKLRFAIRSKNEFEYPIELFKKFKKYLDLRLLMFNTKYILSLIIIVVFLILTSFIKNETRILEKKIQLNHQA